MQGQQGPCQDAICSMPACLWPQAMTLGDGSALGPMPHSSFPQNLLVVRSEIRHLFCEKEFLSVSLRGKKEARPGASTLKTSVGQGSFLSGTTMQGEWAHLFLPRLMHLSHACRPRPSGSW